MTWNTIREKKGEVRRMQANKIVEMSSSPKAHSSDSAGQEKAKDDSAKEANKDLQSGMEMLELDFLLSIVENTDGNDPNDVTMRKLNFYELLRRQQLNAIDSSALKVYAVNEHNLYDKTIQCEALNMLTERTVRKGKHGD
jgi:hypothetical protein